MRVLHTLKTMALAAAAMVAATIQFQGDVLAQAGWRPEKPVEIIVPTGAGGTNDQMARLIQKGMVDHKLVSVPALVINKSGGNQSLAVVYLNQHTADPHYLLYSTATVFTNEIAGLTKQRYTELSPIALLLVDYTVITVKADSPIKSMRDLLARLKADPESAGGEGGGRRSEETQARRLQDQRAVGDRGDGRAHSCDGVVRECGTAASRGR
jgi:putative tricarboxylic transport membrane protein